MTRTVTHSAKQWSNAREDRIDIVDPDPAWTDQFHAEAHALGTTLAAISGIRIVHFGSTAIAGLRAKPVIDILVIHPDPAAWPLLVDWLAPLGYVFWEQNPRRDRMFFVKGMPPFGSRRTHHVHVRVPADAIAEIAFRDMLRADPALVRRYAELKDALALRYPDDRELYTEAKTVFIDEVLGASGQFQSPAD